MCKSKPLHGIIGMDKEILSTPSLITLRIAKFLLLVGLKFTSFQHLHNTLTLIISVLEFFPQCSKKNYYQRKGKKKEAKQYTHILEVRTSMGYKLFLPNTLRVISAEDKFRAVINLGQFLIYKFHLTKMSCS